MSIRARAVVLVSLALCLSGCWQVGAPVEPGNTVVHISGLDAEGRLLQLSDFRGKVVLLDFWFTECTYCQLFAKTEPTLLARFEKRPFVILGVNSDPTREKLVATQQREKLPCRSWWDGPAGPITSQWAVRGFPSIYLIDHLGHVRYHWSGLPRKPGEVENAIEKLVEEAEQHARAERS